MASRCQPGSAPPACCPHITVLILTSSDPDLAPVSGPDLGPDIDMVLVLILILILLLVLMSLISSQSCLQNQPDLLLSPSSCTAGMQRRDPAPFPNPQPATPGAAKRAGQATSSSSSNRPSAPPAERSSISRVFRGAKDTETLFSDLDSFSSRRKAGSGPPSQVTVAALGSLRGYNRNKIPQFPCHCCGSNEA